MKHVWRWDEWQGLQLGEVYDKLWELSFNRNLKPMGEMTVSEMSHDEGQSVLEKFFQWAFEIMPEKIHTKQKIKDKFFIKIFFFDINLTIKATAKKLTNSVIL